MSSQVHIIKEHPLETYHSLEMCIEGGIELLQREKTQITQQNSTHTHMHARTHAHAHMHTHTHLYRHMQEY